MGSGQELLITAAGAELVQEGLHLVPAWGRVGREGAVGEAFSAVVDTASTERLEPAAERVWVGTRESRKAVCVGLACTAPG